MIDQVNAIACPGAAGQAQYGTAGITFHGPPQTHLAIFELLSSPSFPDLEGAPTDISTVSRPRLRRPGWFGVTSTGRTTSPRTARPSAATAAPAARKRPFGIGARHTSDTNLAYPTPAFQGGDQVYCHWNRQSGRWEIVSDGTPWFIRYAKVQDGYTNFLMSGFFPYVSNARSVPIKFCDADGSNEWGIVEDFPLPGWATRRSVRRLCRRRCFPAT